MYFKCKFFEKIYSFRLFIVISIVDNGYWIKFLNNQASVYRAFIADYCSYVHILSYLNFGKIN